MDELPERLDGTTFLKHCALLRGYEPDAAERAATDHGHGVALRRDLARGLRYRGRCRLRVVNSP